MSLLIDRIGELVTNDPTRGDGSPLGLIRDAALVIEDGHVSWVGASATAPAADERLDAGGRVAIPGFVDSHSQFRDEFAV